MAAGSPFTMIPHKVIPSDPVFFNIITESNSMKKEYINVASDSTDIYKLEFKAKSLTDKGTILNHYNDQYAGYHNFTWESVPAYINSGVDMLGRWVDKSLKMIPTKGGQWDFSIDFERQV